jgi:hypothetical protein
MLKIFLEQFSSNAYEEVKNHCALLHQYGRFFGTLINRGVCYEVVQIFRSYGSAAHSSCHVDKLLLQPRRMLQTNLLSAKMLQTSLSTTMLPTASTRVLPTRQLQLLI